MIPRRCGIEYRRFEETQCLRSQECTVPSKRQEPITRSDSVLHPRRRESSVTSL